MLKTSKTHNHSRIKGKEMMKMETFGPKLSELYEKDVVCLSSDDTAFDAAKLMLDEHIGDIVITESKNGKSIPVGIVTDRDIIINSTAKELAPESVQLSEIMSKKLITAKEDSSLTDLVKMMTEEGISRLPIVDESGELKGILTSKRLFQYFAQGLCELSTISSQQHQREEKTH